MSNWKIEDVNRINDEINEMSLDIDGLSYLVIFGGHANGGFCAIPQMGVSCELSSHDKFEDIRYDGCRLLCGDMLHGRTGNQCYQEVHKSGKL